MVNENIEFLKSYDPEIGNAIGMELARQRRGIELIASENFVSPAVLAAMGSPLTNKYAEGYPGKRDYCGCECVDIVENIAIERAKKLFGAEHANVQPHSGAQANTAVYFAMLNPGDTVLGMSLQSLVSGAMICEQVFSWPGTGQLAVTAVTTFDYPLIMGITMLTALLIVLGNLLADILYSIVDPRIRNAV